MNLNIGAHLGLIFGIALWLVLNVIAIALVRVNRAGKNDHGTVDSRQSSKADAAPTTTAIKHTNAKWGVEAFTVNDSHNDNANLIRQLIQINEYTIDGAVKALNKMVATPEDQSLLDRLQETRAAYVDSLRQVNQFLTDGQIADTGTVARDETLPVTAKPQPIVQSMVDR